LFNANSSDDLAEQVVALPRKEREALARQLVEELVSEASKEVEG